ncbi:FtsX-like permease family protein [Nonomuraea sp. NPDC050556]|uniref:FtsX-like permease family protein n=1 Tax=Nonomuraea sp. NPDC050556 TaxID=3364369 RepID=UPI00378BCACE
MTIVRLGLTLARVHRGTAALLAALMLGVTLLCTVLPRTFESSYQDALKQAIAAEPPADLELAVHRTTARSEVKFGSAADIGGWRATIERAMRPALRGLLGPPTYGVRSVGQQVVGRAGTDNVPNNFVDLAWDSGVASRIRYVKGGPPGPGTTEYELALPTNVVTEMHADVGTVFELSGRARARVTGLYEPVDPADPFWAAYPSMAQARVPNPFANVQTAAVTGVIAEAAAGRLTTLTGPVEYRWGYPVRAEAARMTLAPGLGPAYAAFAADMRKQGSAFAVMRVGSGLPAVMDGFLSRLSSTQTLMLLQLTAVATAAFCILLLVIGLLSTRLADSLVAARARAASTGQIVGLGGVVLAVALLPATAAGYALARLVPGLDTPVSLFGPALIALAAIGYGLATMGSAHRRPLSEGREDVAGKAFSPRRLVVDLLVVGLAVVAAYLANSRGVVSGGDPLLVAAPTAVALAVALIILRGYPYVLRGLSRATARGRRPVTFLALATAARAGTVATLPALVLVPALTMSVYGTLTLNALGDSQNVAAWQQTGADALVEASGALAKDAAEKMRQVPGVEAVVAADLGTGRLAGGRTTFSVLAVDLDAYGKLLERASPEVARRVSAMGAAVRGAKPGSALPIVATESFGVAQNRLIVWEGKGDAPVPLTRAGSIDAFPGVSVQDPLVVVPLQAVAEAGLTPAPNRLYVFGPRADPAALAAAAGPTAQVTTREAAIAAITGAPLTSTIKLAFQIVSIALAVASLLAVWITVVAGAGERSRNIALLRTLGMSSRQAQAVVIGEIAPLIVLAGAAGLLLGMGFPALFGRAVDLSGHAGGLPVGYTLTWTAPLLLAAGVTAAALLGAVVQVTLAVRRSAGSVLRAGE